MSMSSGQKLWQRAIRAIPGGNGLLSKRPDRYAPDIWPTYFSRARGVEVTDVDGLTYVDMAQMGLGSAILGYGHPELTRAVCDAAAKGVNCTLNCTEEVELAELLLSLDSFAGGVRFARTGGEAMAMAVRIARAYSRRDKVLFSGYHGWCDWYLAANLAEGDGLAEHLLPGLEPAGVPSALAGTAVPFRYNDVDHFIEVLSRNQDVGVICIEGARYELPSAEFLEAIVCEGRRREVVLICDEITSGWRMTESGAYKGTGFDPDIVVYGKAMGGGFAIAAVVGRRDVMDAAQDSFMSSTMWTERIGFVAAIATISVLSRERGWEKLTRLGDVVGQGWLRLASRYNLRLSVTDFKPLVTFKLGYGKANDVLVTLYIQEMLKRGYLAAPSVYLSIAHDEAIIARYLEAADEVFKLVARAASSADPSARLETRPRTDAFQRLTT